jgi:hypothetical protein
MTRITVQMSDDAAGDLHAINTFLGMFVNYTVEVQRPGQEPVTGDVEAAGWSEEHQSFGLTLAPHEDGSPNIFVPYDSSTSDLTVIYL